MQTPRFLKHFALLLAFVFTSLSFGSRAVADEEYSFKVHNKTKSTIKYVLVSENKKKWGKFNVGKGIEAGKTVKLIWGKSTNDQGCKQWIRAVYADGSESEPAKFDFCEEDLVIEFEE